VVGDELGLGQRVARDGVPLPVLGEVALDGVPLERLARGGEDGVLDDLERDLAAETLGNLRPLALGHGAPAQVRNLRLQVVQRLGVAIELGGFSDEVLDQTVVGVVLALEPSLLLLPLLRMHRA